MQDGDTTRERAVNGFCVVVDVYTRCSEPESRMDTDVGAVHSRKGRRKPKVPIEKLSTGGTAPTLNSEDACSIVPSPPRVMTRSIGSASGPMGPLSMDFVHFLSMT